MRAAFDTVIVDIGGKDTRDLREAIAIADKTIVPIKPSPADLRTLPNFADFIRRINGALDAPKDVRVVMNMVNGSSNQYRRFIDGFEEFRDSLRLLDTRLCDRVAYQNAYEAGRGVHELSRGEYDSKAAAEIDNLYQEIFDNE
jgi:chromosome partitioning protein